MKRFEHQKNYQLRIVEEAKEKEKKITNEAAKRGCLTKHYGDTDLTGSFAYNGLYQDCSAAPGYINFFRGLPLDKEKCHKEVDDLFMQCLKKIS